MVRVALLTSDSPCQRALAQRIATVPGVTLAGLVVQEIQSTMRMAWVKRAVTKDSRLLANKALQRLFYGRVLRQIPVEEVRHFGGGGVPLPWPDTRLVRVKYINGKSAVEALLQIRPDLIAVSGTRLVKEPIFALNPPRGLVNLHTGISPFYKGGPTCTLWCLANHEPQFIGSTVHVLDLGIDSGDILLTAQTPVEAGDSLETLMWKTVALGHDLYTAVLEALACGLPLQAVPQGQVGKGRTYMTREWTVFRLARAVRYIRSGGLQQWVAAGRAGLDAVRLVDAIAAAEAAGSEGAT